MSGIEISDNYCSLDMLIPLEGVEEHSFTEREIVIHNAKYEVICADEKPDWYEG